VKHDDGGGNLPLDSRRATTLDVHDVVSDDDRMFSTLRDLRAMSPVNGGLSESTCSRTRSTADLILSAT